MVVLPLVVDTNNCAPPANEAQARELAPLVKADPEAAALTSAYRAPVRLLRRLWSAAILVMRGSMPR